MASVKNSGGACRSCARNRTACSTPMALPLIAVNFGMISSGAGWSGSAARYAACASSEATRYAKIANRTVADEYFAVTEKVEALYGQGKPLPANLAGPRMNRLRREHHRLLGNGYCTRPPELDCAFEAICETCTFFQTSIEFRPTLQRQRDHAADHDQTHRADLFDRLLTRIDETAS
jgi:hypothetical protein